MKKFSVAQCKEILEKNGAHYTDEEIEKIRDLLYRLVEIDHKNYRYQTEKGKKQEKNLDNGK
jgi:hypothetical protein